MQLRIIVLGILVVAAAAHPAFLLGVASLQIGSELGFDALGLGVLTSAFFLAAATTSIPAGRFAERIGWRRALVINMAITAVVTLAIGTLVDDLFVFGALLVTAAAGYGLANPAVNLVVAERLPRGRQGLAFGLKHAGIPTAALLAGLAVPLVVLQLGWRWGYGFNSVFALAVLLWVVVEPEAPPHPESAGVVGASGDGGAMPQRLLVLLAGAVILATLTPMALGTFLVRSAVDVGITEAAAGILVSIGGLASIAARITVGAAADRRPAQRAGFLMMASLLLTGGVVVIVLAFALPPLFGVLAVAAFATGWGWPGLLTYLVVAGNPAAPGAASAVSQAGVFAGAGLGPVLLGWVVSTAGFRAMWIVVAVSLLITGLIVGSLGWWPATEHEAPQASVP